MQFDRLPEPTSPVHLLDETQHDDAERDLDALFDARATCRLRADRHDDDPAAIARAIRADAERVRAPAAVDDGNANNRGDEPATLRAAAITAALTAGYDRVRDSRVGANHRVEILAGDVGDERPEVGILEGVLETVFGTVSQELMKAVTTKLGPALLGKIILRGFDRLLSMASKAAVGAATSALRKVRSDAADRALFFLGVEEGIRGEAFHAAMGALEALAEGQATLPVSVAEVAECFDDLATEAARVQDRASRTQWLGYLAQSRLGRMDHDVGVATREGATGGTALAMDSSRNAPGVLQVEIAPDLETIVRAWLPGAGAVQGPDMETRTLVDLGIPVRFQIGGRRDVILVNENGRANASGTALRRVLCVLGGGPERASEDFVWGDGRRFVEAGLARAVDVLMRQRLGSRLASP